MLGPREELMIKESTFSSQSLVIRRCLKSHFLSGTSVFSIWKWNENSLLNTFVFLLKTFQRNWDWSLMSITQKLKVKVTQSYPTLCIPMDCSLPGFLCSWDFSGKNTGVGCHVLLQGIFLTKDGTYVSCVACTARFFTISATSGGLPPMDQLETNQPAMPETQEMRVPSPVWKIP